MTVVLDTSVLAAFVNPRDPLHKAAQEILERCSGGELGKPVSSEHILIEGLTLLQRRAGRPEVSRCYAALFTGGNGVPSLVHPLRTGREELGRAVEAHFRHFAKRLSVVDCVLLVMAEDMDAPIASFDTGFDGLVERIAR
ncbi:MAG: type II toxin-antitoxin system VapC family toxin [Euryarchaeota archaeon]|nr:type II toxin-antitoxin system VapC family toxin [Euryarchaeota archaeon]